RACPSGSRKMEGLLPNVVSSVLVWKGILQWQTERLPTGGIMTQAYSSDVAFSPSVKAVQARKGLRPVHARIEERGGWETGILPDLSAFIGAQTSVFFATASAGGQPYIQHRGGPPGFLRVLDNKTIAFVDFAGNRQYITQGNLTENAKAYLFLIDYAHRRRVKLWGEARVVEDDDELIARLMPQDYKARPEQVILFTLAAWDTNCQQHIPQRFDAEDVAQMLMVRGRRIAELEAEIERLRAGAATVTSGE